ncbi:MAG: flagellar motor switch protein FliG [Lysobacteraceae bacterium]|jgi:flagellar motor switch protein FliG|nr:flagellar motor switch protein FliG [Xanthomonadaceae bacterium]MCZ8319548.1 flagellar motor switch protein FliG [Silanimonas sp.]
MADKNGEFSGVEKAAILMLSLGEGEAAEVLKHMTAKEVQKVGQAMAAVGGVSREQIEKVMGDFAIALDKQTSVGIGADDYVRKVLVQALGEDKAGSVIDRILLGRNSSGMEMLKWMDPRAIADLIRNEHPQIMAIVLSHLEPDQAADTLRNFPERVRADVLLRVATLDNVPPVALNELNEVMEKQFAGAQGSKATTIGGVKVAANILNFVDSGQDQVILGAIGKIDQALSDQIQDLMFVFDDLATLDDKSMQAVLREVPGDRLPLALRGGSDDVKEKVLRNMSQRAAAILKEDMDDRGPVKLSEVEAAQKEVLQIVRRLADEGTISLSGAKDEFV